MPRPLLGYGPERARRVAVLRAIGVAIAVVLGAVAVWLIVTGSSQKRIELGVLAGLWGFLIGAYCTFGARPPVPADPPVALMPAFDPNAFSSGAGVLDLRAPSDVERQDEAAARREMQAQLEKVLRREVQEGLARELAGLRAEVAALRSELVEKVGGELRLERIETTRLIGSDIEALQRQMRELKTSNVPDDGGPADYEDVDELDGVDVVEDAELVEDEPEPAPAPRRDAAVTRQVAQSAPVSVAKAPVSVAKAPVSVAKAPVEPEPEPEPAPAPPEPEPEPAPAPPEPEPEPAPAPPEPEPEPAPAPPEPEPERPSTPVAEDPFAAMPRLSPFTDFEPVSEPEPAAATAAAEPRRGGRRYREDDSEDNVLARILQREGTRSP